MRLSLPNTRFQEAAREASSAARRGSAVRLMFGRWQPSLDRDDQASPSHVALAHDPGTVWYGQRRILIVGTCDPRLKLEQVFKSRLELDKDRRPTVCRRTVEIKPQHEPH